MFLHLRGSIILTYLRLMYPVNVSHDNDIIMCMFAMLFICCGVNDAERQITDRTKIISQRLAK